MTFRPDKDHVYAFKSKNARVWPRPENRIVGTSRSDRKQLIRFGAAHLIALVVLELGATRRMDGWDMDWYEGEVLRRLRARLFAEYAASFRDAEQRQTSEEHFDWLANTYQLDSIDLDAVLTIGKRRYYKVLLFVLRSILEDEGSRGEIARHVLRRYRLRRTEWQEGSGSPATSEKANPPATDGRPARRTVRRNRRNVQHETGA